MSGSAQKKMKKMIIDILQTKGSEIKAEVYAQICKMPLRKRFIFALKVIFKRI